SGGPSTKEKHMPTTTRTIDAAVAAAEALPHQDALGRLGQIPPALLLGALAATAIRRSRLHWTWAALAAILALCLVPLFGSGARLAAVAAGWAALRARRRHRADLAGAARARVRPTEAARELTARIAEDTAVGRRLLDRLPRRKDDGMLVLGRDASRRQVRVPFSPAEPGHTL